MSKFVSITTEVVEADEAFAKYLKKANIITSAKKGGAFIGTYEVAPDEFRKYGIVLPKGGMIIPEIHPKDLKEILTMPDRLREMQDLKLRRDAEETYHNQVKEVLAKSGTSDIFKIVIEEGNTSTSRWRKSFLVRVSDEEKVLLLHIEEEDYHGWMSTSYKEWRSSFSPLEKVEFLVQQKIRLAEARRLFIKRIEKLTEISYSLGQDVVEDGEKAMKSWGFNPVERYLHPKPSNDSYLLGVYSVEVLKYEGSFYELNEKNIAYLEAIFQKRVEQGALRLEQLKKTFFQERGVWKKVMEGKWSNFAFRSYNTGKVKSEEWEEPHYFIGGEEVSPREYRWLNTTFLSDIDVPAGHVRVANDTNDLLPVPEMPGRNDVLVVVGKAGKSQRGVWSYREWFRGHPSGCETSFWNRGIERKILSVTLNGQVQESNSFDLSPWKDPHKLARRALREAGIENPANEYIEALAEEYRRQLDT